VKAAKKQSQLPAFGRKLEALSPKSETILQNKANLPDRQIGAMSAIAMIYGDFGGWRQRKNKANCRPLAGNPKH